MMNAGNSSMPESVDTFIEIIIAVFFCILGLSNFVVIRDSLNAAEMAQLNYDKVSIIDTEEKDPFTMTAYQVYMLGYTIDNYGPKNKSGVLFADNGNGAVSSVFISPEDYHYSYTVRNKMISDRESVSVSKVVEKGNISDLTSHYRGLNNVRYRLKLSDDFVSEYSNIMSDDGITVLEGDRKEFIWTASVQ